MNLESLIAHASNRGASDLHLEPGLPAALRIQGELVTTGEPLSGGLVRGLVREAVGEAHWEDFCQRRSWDLACILAGVRCRINALTSMRGVGLAIRLLPAILPSLDGLNLHPDLKKLAALAHGLVLVSGPTGCGKSSTLAALLQEINASRAHHILTVEQPIEYNLKPNKAFIRQREVGRDTPSFEQALLDALREDPDVIMVGELRDPETMRLALTAAETGHLMLASLHSANVAEAVQRMVLAFPAQIQASVAAQLADCLQAVICQRLVYRADLDLRLPECEILLATPAARNNIRHQEWFRLPTVLETGGADGQWSRERYRAWLAAQSDFRRPDPATVIAGPLDPPGSARPRQTRSSQATAADSEVMVIDEPDRDARDILSELERNPAVKKVPIDQ